MNVRQFFGIKWYFLIFSNDTLKWQIFEDWQSLTNKLSVCCCCKYRWLHIHFDFHISYSFIHIFLELIFLWNHSIRQASSLLSPIWRLILSKFIIVSIVKIKIALFCNIDSTKNNSANWCKFIYIKRKYFLSNHMLLILLSSIELHQPIVNGLLIKLILWKLSLSSGTCHFFSSLVDSRKNESQLGVWKKKKWP